MLKSIEYINIQSYEREKFEFTPGLNVICGDNNYGKSVLFKVVVVLNKYKTYMKDLKELRSLVRKGNNSATILMSFYSGMEAELYISKKGQEQAEIVFYIDKELYTGTDTPRVLLDELNLLIYGNKEPKISNYILPKNSTLLVDSDEEETHELLERFQMDSLAEDIKEYLGSSMEELKYHTKNLTMKSNYLKNELEHNSYRDLGDLEYVNDLMYKVYKVTNILDEALDVSSSLKPSMTVSGQLRELIVITKFLEMTSSSLVVKNLNVLDSAIIDRMYEDSKSIINCMININDILSYVKDEIDIDFNKDVIEFVSTMNDILNYSSNIKEYEKVTFNKNTILFVEELINIKLMLTSIKEIPEFDISKVTVAKSLDTLSYYIKKYREHMVLDKIYNTKMNSLIKEREDLGAVEVDCPIHGKVIYSEGHCINYIK